MIARLTDQLAPFKKQLIEHPIYQNIDCVSDLRCFMESHVYAVWDFMSIVKSLQNHICPSSFPWKPSEYTKNGIAHLINEIVYSEESDVDDKGRYFSHFDLYIKAMNDVGADTSHIMSLIENYDYNNSIKNKLSICIPQEGLNFIENTFNCIKTSKLSFFESFL